MVLSPEQLLQDLDTANKDVQDIRMTVGLMKKGLMDAETAFIEATIRQARIVEQLRILRNTTVSEEITDRQQEIERFRRNNSETCAIAKQRDEKTRV